MKKIILAFFLLGAGYGYCDSASDTVQAKLNAIHTMSASFNQVVSAKKREISHSAGTMALSRPGHFRWKTITPMEQLVVADGEKLWVYDADLEQVTVKKQDKGIGGTAALFLSGYGDTVARDFDVTHYREGDKEYFDLHSKSGKANFQRVKLIFIGDELRGLELFDPLGQQTHVQLSNVKHNVVLAASLFKFTPPKGADVVRQ